MVEIRPACLGFFGIDGVHQRYFMAYRPGGREITKLSGPGYVAAVVLVDLITVVLVSTTVQWWVGRWLLASWYGYRPRR